MFITYCFHLWTLKKIIFIIFLSGCGVIRYFRTNALQNQVFKIQGLCLNDILFLHITQFFTNESVFFFLEFFFKRYLDPLKPGVTWQLEQSTVVKLFHFGLLHFLYVVCHQSLLAYALRFIFLENHVSCKQVTFFKLQVRHHQWIRQVS